MSNKETIYQSVYQYTDDDALSGAEAEPAHQYRCQSPYEDSCRRKFLSYGLIFIITSVIWIVVLLTTSPYTTRPWTRLSKFGDPHHNITSNARLETCGNTTEEARARGCQYDVLLNNWVSAKCIDQDFIDEYTDDDSWGAFADEKLTQKLTVEEMSEAEFYYTSLRDHINHCGMMWKRQFWALYTERRAFDAVISSPGHTDHCALFLMDRTDVDPSEATKVDRGFAGCWVRD